MFFFLLSETPIVNHARISKCLTPEGIWKRERKKSLQGKFHHLVIEFLVFNDFKRRHIYTSKNIHMQTPNS